MIDLVGRVLKNRYRIDAYLGRGGMAEVYRAFDTRRNYLVAIKVMHPDYAEDREFVRRFRQEAESLSELAHDNIVRFYSLERDHGITFLVMGSRWRESSSRPMPIFEDTWTALSPLIQP